MFDARSLLPHDENVPPLIAAGPNSYLKSNFISESLVSYEHLMPFVTEILSIWHMQLQDAILASSIAKVRGSMHGRQQ